MKAWLSRVHIEWRLDGPNEWEKIIHLTTNLLKELLSLSAHERSRKGSHCMQILTSIWFQPVHGQEGREFSWELNGLSKREKVSMPTKLLNLNPSKALTD